MAVPSQAQVPELINNPQFRPDAKAAVDSIYNFNFAGADKVMAPWKNRYPNHPLWQLLDGMKFWWKVLSDLEDTSHDERFYTLMKKADYRAGKLLHRQPNHADALLIRAIANGYLARQYANRSEWVTSVNYGRKAMNAHQNLSQQQPGLEDLKLAEGLKLYYSAYLPEAYPIVKTISWALPDGDKKEGLALIHQASRQAVFASAEATYFLGNINYNYEDNYAEAVESFERLYEQYPRNNYYARILAKSYYKLHEYGKGLAYINKTLKKWEQQNLPHQRVMKEELLTWKGRILEQKGYQQEALECYQKAFAAGNELPNPDQRSFFVVSGYLAGKILYDHERFDEAKSYLKKVVGTKAESEYRERARNLLSKVR